MAKKADHAQPDGQPRRSCLQRRQFLKLGLMGATGLGVHDSSALAGQLPDEGELLYNGIRLPSPWPPRLEEIPRRPVVPAYLSAPPAVIPIDVGRQLFVDDFLIAQTTLTRTHHRTRYHPGNPVLTGGMVFSDGVWHDPQDRLFKMWYMTPGGTAYAVSKDGLAWDKPKLDVHQGTNLVETTARDSSTVWLDLEEGDARRRFKMFRTHRPVRQKPWHLAVHFSADGIHWTKPEMTGLCGDRTTVFYNPFRRAWVYSLRNGPGAPRRRRYWETRADVIKGAQWGDISAPPLWCGADELDPARADYRVTPELYNLDCVAYESILLGLFTIWRGQFPERPKPNEVCVGYSRDGWSWSRPDRRGFIPISENKADWNWGNVQSAGGGCLVVGDKLYFYCSGRGQGNVTSLATLRRDGFVSMDAGKETGTLTTRPVQFRGRHLFVNVDAPVGELRAEILDQGGKLIPAFGRDRCTAIRADHTAVRVQWQGSADLNAVRGQSVRLRFHLANGKLYAFWVSPEVTGASHGYMAAGGPGFTGLRDTVGDSRGL
jgi:hypothetical protein